MLLKRLVNANGLPTYEDEVRNIIKEELKDCVDRMYTDRLGNLIAVKNESASGRHIALSAHMDEAGMIVQLINKSGTIKFAAWGVDQRVLVAKTVLIGEKRIKGVIGSKPIHLQKPEERTVPLSLDSLYIDIGTDSKEETDELVSIGDYVAFDSEYREFGDGRIAGKAFGGRTGCAAIIELLKSRITQKVTAIFTVQRMVSQRGAVTAAMQVSADIVINLDATLSADTYIEEETAHCTKLGAGPAISLKDAGSIFFRKYIDFVIKTAEKKSIPYQFRATAKGASDAASYHIAHGGTPVIGIGLPCRYLHSPVSVIDKKDYENYVMLVKELVAGSEEAFK